MKSAARWMVILGAVLLAAPLLAQHTASQLANLRHWSGQGVAPVYEGFRPGDIRHSQADVGKARRLLGYDPTYDVRAGLREALPWYEARLSRLAAVRKEAMQRVDDVT